MSKFKVGDKVWCDEWGYSFCPCEGVVTVCSEGFYEVDCGEEVGEWPFCDHQLTNLQETKTEVKPTSWTAKVDGEYLDVNICTPDEINLYVAGGEVDINKKYIDVVIELLKTAKEHL